MEEVPPAKLFQVATAVHLLEESPKNEAAAADLRANLAKLTFELARTH